MTRNMGDKKNHEGMQDNLTNPVSMIIEFRREMETLKRKSTKELKALREENARLKQ